MHVIAALVWCGVVAARPMAMPCPMGGHGEGHEAAAHSGHIGTSADASADASHGHHVGMINASPAGLGATPESPRTPAPKEHSCDCLGHCCAVLATRPGASAPVVAFVEHAVEPPAPHVEVRYIAAWTDFVLPFAIAPPVSART